jgi:hypothetical protein
MPYDVMPMQETTVQHLTEEFIDNLPLSYLVPEDSGSDDPPWTDAEDASCSESEDDCLTGAPGCTLQQNAFYLQRPPVPNTNEEPFTLVRAKQVILDEAGHPVGAWVQIWQLATIGDPRACFYSDPWWACADMPDRQRNSPAKPWTYINSPLSEFQAEVLMTDKWPKPAGWAKLFVGGAQAAARVPKRAIKKKAVADVRGFVLRWA